MKLTQTLLNQLDDLSRISTSVLLSPGKTISIKNGPQILATAIIDEEIPGEAAVYDLPLFLKTLSLFPVDEAVLEFNDSYIEVKSAGQNARFVTADKKWIENSIPSKTVDELTQSSGPLGEIVLDIALEKTIVDQLLKNIKIMSLDHVRFSVEDGVFSIKICDLKNTGQNSLDKVIAEVDCPNLSYTFSTEEFLKMPSYDYQLKLFKDVASVAFENDNFGIFLSAQTNFTKRIDE